MSLRLRLILGFTSLILLLGLAVGWGVSTLGRELDDALGDTATRVGRAVVHVLRHGPVAGHSATGERHVIEREVRIVRRDEKEKIADDSVPTEGDGIAASVVSPDDLDFTLGPPEADSPATLQLRHHGNVFDQVELPGESLQSALHDFRARLGWGLLLLFALAVLASIWLAARITAPLQALAAAAAQVGRGARGVRLDEQGPPEVRQSIAAFNRMSADLARLDAETARLRADRELAELGEIGRGLAHSLRNPLHALGLSLDALAESATPDARTAERIATGREQLARIDQTLRGFLALAAGAEAQAQPVRLRELVDDVLLEASQRPQGRVRLQRDCAELQLHGVPAELRILLHVLVVNALEASPADGIVSLRVQASDGAGVVIEVEDDGPGIAADIRARLFEPHVSSKPAGAGMGLYLAERLARLRYRGRLQLIERTPHGCLARLELHDRSPPDGH